MQVGKYCSRAGAAGEKRVSQEKQEKFDGKNSSLFRLDLRVGLRTICPGHLCVTDLLHVGTFEIPILCGEKRPTVSYIF